ncbi:MAG: 16S rRNA (cytidine(1402)-2'-O)-methyltransferase [Polyangiaceae bacterium]|nr:16S rRNA (cytidine(1402)-2'-O)-methyltransferase [Polyangiaceae bacterium]
MSGALLVVGTPIGNLEDLSPRAARALAECDAVLAEDTRRARQLLAHLGVEKKELVRHDAHATEADHQRALARLLAGETLALVTDAGTPGVSDPGASLVARAASAGVRVSPIPGASAVVAAVAASGFGRASFRFVGFLPRDGSARDDALSRAAADPDVVVFFESPRRVAGTLAELARLCPTREAMVARELTKLHEELVRGSVAELAADPREWLGELTIALGPWEAPVSDDVDAATIDRWLGEQLALGATVREAARVIAARSGWPKREVYARAVGLAARREG